MTPTAPTTERIHITRTSDVCGGKPCISGTRIRVLDVYVWHELQGKSVDEIVHEYPQLTHADVFSALAYLWDHREEVVRSHEEETATADRFKAMFPSRLQTR
jgi:uncharacterized protein (DUF433 family)